MSDKSEASVIGSLPRSRPQRRSDKRGARSQPQPAAAPHVEEPAETSRAEPPNQDAACAPLPDGAELLATVVKATAELAEIGLTLGARALRTAVSRLPRP